MSAGNITPTTPATNPSASAARETRTVAVSGSVRMSDDVLILVTAGIVLSLLGAATPLAPPPNTDPFAPLRGGGGSGPSQGYEFDALNISGGACTVSGNGANIELDGAAGAANVAIADGARIKFAWSATASRWIGNSFGVGGGAVVALAGDTVGPSNNNRLQQIRGDAVNAIAALVSGATIKQTQGGTAAAPAREYPIIIQPRATTDGLPKASFAFVLGTGRFLSTDDEVIDFGYNADNAIPAEPTARFTIESDYEFAPGQRQMEMHWQFSSMGGGQGPAARVLTAGFDRATFAANVGIRWRDPNGYFYLTEESTGAPQWKWLTGGCVISPTNYGITALNGFTLTATTHGYLDFTFGQGTLQGRTAVNLRGDQIHLEKSNATDVGYIETANAGNDNYSWVLAGTRSFYIAAQGIQVGAVKDFGGGFGVVGVSKATVNPTANPTTGYIEYSDAISGSAQIRDPLGAVSNVSGGFFTQAMANAPQTISAANSASKYYRTTGANTAVRALTISLPPNIGTMIVVRNDCTAFGITVQFSSGAATGTILPGTSALICGDGVNAFIMMSGT